jgi:hypothetical protein
LFFVFGGKFGDGGRNSLDPENKNEEAFMDYVIPLTVSRDILK